MKASVRLLTTHAAAAVALLMVAPLAEANSGYGGSYAPPSYGSGLPVVSVVPDANGKVYLEATYDPAIGAYVYPERIEVQGSAYRPPMIYRAKRIYYEGYTPVVPTR
ncbi:hypothetical protein [uncultured Cohaesibacter sp.]|uniref:hypothetical protein n=1 Tax=uncultured Cohaesibacter sp. TaxID=1002546 RepID=UPI002AAA6417|nr:hypothetical protein [uncultured Cohaesibacter sp.]